ncbi:MAG: hypothetical protein HY301_19940 [Verrucomicrobia bacterium]|nr:hypothetical protein [Verrucomicrobiota bacterium]
MRLLFSNSAACRRGFTMVELALCLGIIGFALVAIIGVLPTGMKVQKDNREETLINQDATFIMETLRAGGPSVRTNLFNFFDQIFTNGTAAAFSNDYDIVGLLCNPYTANSANVRALAGVRADQGASAGAKNFTFAYQLDSQVSLANTMNNLWEVRLTFRWPLVPNVHTGAVTKTFRTQVAAQLVTNNAPLYFFQQQQFPP